MEPIMNTVFGKSSFFKPPQPEDNTPRWPLCASAFKTSSAVSSGFLLPMLPKPT
jgi:hypothetical protein